MLNCFVKKLFGLLFVTICYFSVDLDYKPPKKSGNTDVADGYATLTENITTCVNLVKNRTRNGEYQNHGKSKFFALHNSIYINSVKLESTSDSLLTQSLLKRQAIT